MLRLLLSLLLVAALAPGPGTKAPPHAWHCTPCDGGCDHETFDHPGKCPRCGMALVESASEAPAPAPRTRVAIVLFDGVEIIDSTGPYEIFGAANFDVFTVAKTHAPLTTAMGLTVVPRYAFDDAPAAQVLVVPGGSIGAAEDDAATIAWIRRASAASKQTMSVCNGAFLLARAGLLDGLVATTTAHNLQRLQQRYPRIRVVDDQRFTDNGKIITTGGLSAGIDGALHVVERLLGRGMAQFVALAEEYDLGGRAAFARATLADTLIPPIDLDSFGPWTIEKTEGTSDHWEVVARIESKIGAALRERVASALAEKGGWTRVGADRFAFPDRRGRPWKGALEVDQSAADAPARLRLSIARVAGERH